MTTKFRIDREALFEQLEYDPHRGQWEVHRSRARRRILASGTRWGKSTVAVYEAIAELLEPRERALGWLVAPTYELTRRIFERVVMVLHQYKQRRIRSYDPRTHSIVVVNLDGGYSELRARSADRPAGLLGDALDFLIVDECTEIRENVWDEYIAARLVDRNGKALLISTPTDVTSWFYKQYRRAKKDKAYASFAMPTASNPHLDPALIEDERGRLTPEQFASQYEAKFTGHDMYPCDKCGGPNVGTACVVALYEGEQPFACTECGRLVDKDGRSCVSLVDGKCHATIIRFVRPRDPEIAVPGGVHRVLQCMPTPENPEQVEDLTPIGKRHSLPGGVASTEPFEFTPLTAEQEEALGVDRVIEVHPPVSHPEELPEGCD